MMTITHKRTLFEDVKIGEWFEWLEDICIKIEQNKLFSITSKCTSNIGNNVNVRLLDTELIIKNS